MINLQGSYNKQWEALRFSPREGQVQFLASRALYWYQGPLRGSYITWDKGRFDESKETAQILESRLHYKHQETSPEESTYMKMQFSTYSSIALAQCFNVSY